MVDIVVKLWMDNGGIVVGFLAMAKNCVRLQNVQTGQGAHRVSYSLGTLVRGRRPEQEFDNSFNLVPRSITSGTICPLSHVSLWCACFYFYSYLESHGAERYGTGLHGQSHKSCKVWHRSVWAVT